MVPLPRQVGARALSLGLCALALAGCRDSPREVLEQASEAAARGDLVAVQSAFSVSTVQRLERAWEIDSTPAARGWERLARRLTYDGKVLGVGEETIHGDYARVMAAAGTEERDYYLRKEDGEWRLELGARLRWARAGPKTEADPPAEGEAKAP